ncbi:MAG: helix-turn-helix domain-containing protein [Acidobacteriota bacterium]|nr:helix-turn-helix domain-containing protein [Acidobacteriota bacterium]
MEKPNKLLYRVSMAAEILDISRSQAYKLIENGTLRSVKIGTSIRIPAEAVQELARDGGQAA